MGHLLTERVVDRERAELDLGYGIVKPDAGTGSQFGDGL